jgi:hypothetical protein
MASDSFLHTSPVPLVHDDPHNGACKAASFHN